VKVRFTKGGRRQFLAAIRYIAEENPSAAVRFRLRAEKRLRPLQQFPHLGRHLPEFPELPHREIILRPYRFFYRVQSATVWVVAVWHGAQIPKAPARGARRTTPMRPLPVKWANKSR
jgi:plasmid stabilization system protein ParE